jgi:hypothetical protein
MRKERNAYETLVGKSHKKNPPGRKGTDGRISN